jgi:predicted enzyme related to lactoylglutathione lyase
LTNVIADPDLDLVFAQRVRCNDATEKNYIAALEVARRGQEAADSGPQPTGFGRDQTYGYMVTIGKRVSQQNFESDISMSIENVLASVAVKDIKAASAWYEQLFGRPGETPMPDLAEWKFPRGGWLQIYQSPERAGHGSFTLAVNDIATEIKKLGAMGLDTSKRSSDSKVKTLMVTDPDGNHIAFAEAADSRLAQ